MTMLGAHLEDLATLEHQLRSAGSAIEQCATGATSATTTVVLRVREAAGEALGRIRAELDAVRASVEQAHGAGAAAVWTGANADRFRTAAGDFRTAMQRAEASTDATYQDFALSIDRMGEALVSYERQLAAALAGAQASALGMAAAVRGQHQALDAAMNVGLAVG